MTARSYAYREISAVIERFEQNPNLYRAENFIERMEAIDVLELQMLDAFDSVDNPPLNTDAEQLSLIQRTAVLKHRLDEANERLFADLLADIRNNDRSTIKQYFEQAGQQISQRTSEEDVGYDEIDMLVNGLLEIDFVPEEPAERKADMMFYQPTHARIVLKLIEELHLTAADIFYDLGSGLGHVPILVNLLTGVRTKGVELHDSYFRYSVECLKKLALQDVEFIHADARQVNYEDGTIFYLYTPFRGEVLRQVLAKLEAQSKQRPIRVCAYGPVTAEVSQYQWLQPICQSGKQESLFGIFVST